MLADTESYARFRVGGNAVAERGTIAPIADSAQHHLVFVGAAALQDKGAVHMSVRPNNKADAHVDFIIFNLQERVGSKQGFRWTNVSTSWQRQRWGYGREFGNMSGHPAQCLF